MDKHILGLRFYQTDDDFRNNEITVELTYCNMIYWNEYKKYKVIAESMIDTGAGGNAASTKELMKLFRNEQTRDQTIENLINILSGGQHFAPLHDFTKIGEQKNLFDNAD